MSFEYRKWWHTTLRLLDRQMLFKTSISTMGSDPSLNADDAISAYLLTCTETAIPPAAFNLAESPGYFIYRPSLDDIGGVSGRNYISPSNYSDVVSLSNRFVFEYQLRYSYELLDTGCTSNGPPDTFSNNSFDTTLDESHGAVFYFPSLPYFEQIGCCEISLANPGEPLAPGEVNDCYRFWGINSDGNNYNLYSWDFSDAGNELVNRGDIRSVGLGTLYFHDITWDSDNKLWGLENQGLRQILPGNEDNNAVALNYAMLTDNFSGDAISELFPIDASEDGYPGMSFNQNNERLYISANNWFFELEKTSDAIWNISRYQNLGEGSELRDLAFDPYGKCYCIYNDNLCNIDFTSAFGTISQITSDDSFSEIVGMDFVLDFDHSQFVNLYATDSSGQISEVDYDTGSISNVTGAIFGAGTLGAASCQPGEDLSIASFPFDPGNSPWMFMIDSSISMNSLNRWTTVIDGMVAFLENNVSLDDEIIIVTYSDTPVASQKFIFRNQNDIQSAIDYVQSLPAPSGNSNFCNNGPFTRSFLQNYQNFKSIVIIGDGAFMGCPTDGSITEYIQSIYDFAKINNPDLTMRAVGIFPDDLGREHLGIAGTVGGGGYTEWL